MAQLNTDLETIKTARDNMKTALEGQGQTVTKDIRTYAQAIANISGGGSSGVKLFNTIEHMQQDQTAQEGDLAVVYRDILVPPTPGDTINAITPPSVVVFDTAVTGSHSTMLMGTMVNINCEVTSTDCTIEDWMGMIIPTPITYTSSDGLTYTRTDSGASRYDLGEDITISTVRPDTISLMFFSVKDKSFDGFFEYSENNNYVAIPQLSTTATKVLKIEFNDHDKFYTDDLQDLYNTINTILSSVTIEGAIRLTYTDGQVTGAILYSGCSGTVYDGNQWSVMRDNTEDTIVYTIDLVNNTYTQSTLTVGNLIASNNTYYYVGNKVNEYTYLYGNNASAEHFGEFGYVNDDFISINGSYSNKIKYGYAYNEINKNV